MEKVYTGLHTAPSTQKPVNVRELSLLIFKPQSSFHFTTVSDLWKKSTSLSLLSLFYFLQHPDSIFRHYEPYANS